jgi:membrane-associated phospholipid phosphatase
MATATATGERASARAAKHHQRAAWRTFPFRLPDLARFAAAWVVLTVLFLGVGALLVHVLLHGAVGDVDRHAAHWFVARRTDTVDHLAQIGAGMADAYTIIPAVVVTVVVFLAIWRRWDEAVFLLTAILLEKAVFVTVTFVIDRPRPPVGQLDGHPPTSSFPSGHVGAAVVFYGVLAVVIWRHTDRRWLRAIVAALAVALPIAVALSRLVLGMHWLTDTIVGAVLGLVAIVVGSALSRRTVEDLDARRELHGSAEVQQPATEGDRTEREPGGAEHQARHDVAQPVRAEQHP